MAMKIGENMKINCLGFVEDIRKRYDTSKKKRLAVIQVGDDAASSFYVNSKVEEGAKWNVDVVIIALSEESSEDKIIEIIEWVNGEETIDGLIVQLPLPEHINTQKVIDSIAPRKNVDGFKQTGKDSLYDPCTPKGIIMLLKSITNLQGKIVTVVGRGKTVGEPLKEMFLKENAAVCVCHSKTPKEKLYELVSISDIVVLAAGKTKLIGACHLRKNTIVIDAGISRIDGKQVGDFSHEELEACEYKNISYTPWVNGVGKLTVAALMMNVRDGYEL